MKRTVHPILSEKPLSYFLLCTSARCIFSAVGYSICLSCSSLLVIDSFWRISVSSRVARRCGAEDRSALFLHLSRFQRGLLREPLSRPAATLAPQRGERAGRGVRPKTFSVRTRQGLRKVGCAPSIRKLLISMIISDSSGFFWPHRSPRSLRLRARPLLFCAVCREPLIPFVSC
jgi:hypothetical protein